MKTKHKPKRATGSLKRRVSRRRETRAIDALIALALHPSSTKPPTDAEIEQFLKECRAGKHKLNAEAKSALDHKQHKFLIELKKHIGKTGNTVYGKPANDRTDAQR